MKTVPRHPPRARCKHHRMTTIGAVRAAACTAATVSRVTRRGTSSRGPATACCNDDAARRITRTALTGGHRVPTCAARWQQPPPPAAAGRAASRHTICRAESAAASAADDGACPNGSTRDASAFRFIHCLALWLRRLLLYTVWFFMGVQICWLHNARASALPVLEPERGVRSLKHFRTAGSVHAPLRRHSVSRAPAMQQQPQIRRTRHLSNLMMIPPANRLSSRRGRRGRRGRCGGRYGDRRARRLVRPPRRTAPGRACLLIVYQCIRTQSPQPPPLLPGLAARSLTVCS